MSAARPSTRMETEAEEAALVAERQLREHPPLLDDIANRLRQVDPQLVITCARGSSDHAATYAKHLIEIEAAVPTASHSPSVSSIFGVKWRTFERVLFLAITQSGQSPDLLLSAKAARDAGALVVSIVNAASSPLSAESWATLPILAGPEQSVAATKSYIGSLLAIAGLVAEWTDSRPLREALAASPQALREAWSLDWSAALKELLGVSDMYVIGRGSTLGIAQEAALKFKETCAIHAEAFSAAEVRHGPMAVVRPGFPVLFVGQSDESLDSVAALASEFGERGASVMSAGVPGASGITLPVVDADPLTAPVLQIASFYRLANALALQRGRDPDRPPHLSKVTETR